MKKTKGITLISLVITVIVLVIIAGVTIASIIGNNNSINKAEEAKLTAEEQSKRAVLEQALIKYNSGNALGSADLKEFLKKELDLTDAQIVDVIDLNGETAYLIKDYLGVQSYIDSVEGVWKIEKFGTNVLAVGMLDHLESGDRLIAPNDGDELEIDKNNYAIISSEDLNNISFDIPADTTVNLKLLSNFTITNEGLKRAAINLNENSVLNLAVYGNVTVNSTFGEDGAISNEAQVKSAGGYAGIHVPPSATLNLNGTGVIKCYGGNAGKGGTFNGSSDSGGSGGGGAGAGIGGNGGFGGAGKSGVSNNGENGESCGTVTIADSLTVYAYGGAGGDGGDGYKAGSTNGGGRRRRLSCCWNRWRWSRRRRRNLLCWCRWFFWRCC